MSVTQGLTIYSSKLYASWKGESGDERIFFSFFNGSQWAPQAQVPGIGTSVGPSLAVFGPKLYAVWKGKNTDQRLFFASFDGTEWSPQTQIPGVGSSIGAAICVFNGKLYAAWKGENYDPRLFYAFFDGSKWSNQTQIPGAASSIGPSLAVFNGKLYAAWKGRNPEQGINCDTDLTLYCSSFDGTNWTPQPKIPGNSSIGPSLHAWDGKLYAAWKDEDDHDDRLFYSTFNDTSWAAQIQIPGVASSIGPVLAVFGGKLYAMWKGSDNDQRLWYASFDGIEWSPSSTLPGNTGQDIISLVWIPDIHLEQIPSLPLCGDNLFGNSGNQPTVWIEQSNWIKNNQSLYNIQAVLSAGDVQMYCPTPAGLLENYLLTAWNEGFAIIDSMNKPYLVTAGNHDHDDAINPSPPGVGFYFDTTTFDKIIGYSKICKKSWYGDYWPTAATDLPASLVLPSGHTNKANQYIKFEFWGRKFLVIALDYLPRQDALNWAAGIINNNPTYEVIIITHCYLDGQGDTQLAKYEDINGSNVDINSWAMDFANVHAILGGHCTPPEKKGGYSLGAGPNESNRVDTANDGHPLSGIYADYQFVNSQIYPDPPPPHPSEIVLLLELSNSQVNVRAFNTSTNTEVFAPYYPYILSW